MSTYAALLAELDGALSAGGSIRHTTILQRLADLFQLGADSYSDDQIAVFDDVFVRLVSRIETSARAALSARLAPIRRAPPALARMLAADDAIDVAAPVLRHCARLSGVTLAELARTKSQAHLLAISLRDYLDRSVTDVLIDRGDREVLLSTARNPGAQFSDFGFTTIIARAKGDDELAACIGSRKELPRRHLLKLLAQASDAARRNLERDDETGNGAVKAAVAEATTSLQAMTNQAARTYEAAERCVDALQAAGELDETAIATFAKARQPEEATVALARLCNMPLETIETAMAGDRPETILILGKAAGLTWATVKSVLALRRNGQGVSPQTLENCMGTFSRMKSATARQVLDFQRKRGLQQPQIV
ncbi:MAG: DUF2336 domain-containing protein [Pseudolabrys sp.]